MDLLLIVPLIVAGAMSIALGLMGAFLFTQKKLLMAEVLSHAAFPGVVVAAMVVAWWQADISVAAIVCASVSSALGIGLSRLLVCKGVSVDAAFSFTLSMLFAVGTLLASGIQRAIPSAWRSVSYYLLGQAATLSEQDALLFALLAMFVVGLLLLLYKQIVTGLFDSAFAALMTLAAVVLGIRALGVVLLSALLVAPPTAARAFVRTTPAFFVLTVLFAAFACVTGVILSWKWGIPTGPIVSLLAAAIAFASLLLAPRRGWIAQLVRALRTRSLVRQENVLKALYKGQKIVEARWRLLFLRARGFLTKEGLLTLKGREKAEHIIRLHRLFELYLTREVGLDQSAVHAIAEEAEHKISPEMEKELEQLLGFPALDPHRQPIPRRPS
jgi:manganese/zinc/iron transport system permease protein